MQCNDEWFRISGHPKTEFQDVDWTPLVVEEDLDVIEQSWARMLDSKQSFTYQCRLKRSWKSVDRASGDTWVSVSGGPEIGTDGELIGAMGTLTDISHLKWTEREQKLRFDEAMEAKRQQESFVDMVSARRPSPILPLGRSSCIAQHIVLTFVSGLSRNSQSSGSCSTLC